MKYEVEEIKETLTRTNEMQENHIQMGYTIFTQSFTDGAVDFLLKPTLL